jgi:hypothetical protein
MRRYRPRRASGSYGSVFPRLYPGIEQCIAGSRVEASATTALTARQHVTLANPPMLTTAGPHPATTGARWKALASGAPWPPKREVAASKIGYGRVMRSRGDNVGIADLHRERLVCVRLMADGLAVAADRPNVGSRRCRSPRRARRRAGEAFADPGVQPADCIERAALRMAARIQQFAASARADSRSRASRWWQQRLSSISKRPASMPSMLVPDMRPI